MGIGQVIRESCLKVSIRIPGYDDDDMPCFIRMNYTKLGRIHKTGPGRKSAPSMVRRITDGKGGDQPPIDKVPHGWSR